MRVIAEPRPRPAWQQELAEGFSRPAELLRYLKLDPALLAPAEEASRLFAMRVPRCFADRMRPGDPRDPLLRQILPLAEEFQAVPGFLEDPVGDLKAMNTPGVIHKYRGRALLVVTGACAVNCRYCFRRHFPYGDAHVSRQRWESALDYVRDHPDLEEIILSGGDPLVLADDRLSALAADLTAIPHLRRLRIHSRLPVVLPRRVDDRLLDWLAGGRLAPVMVIHANHPAEIDGPVRAACARLREAGVTLLNQSVLLRGVNDDPAVLADLSNRLFEAGVLPYYLHVLDRVQGAAHFLVPEDEARTITARLGALLPGYLVPRLVREDAGMSQKTPLAPTPAPPS